MSADAATTSALAPIPTPDPLPAPATLAAVRGYVADSLAPSTRRAYRAALAAFRAWCDAEGVSPLPARPETVAAFLAAEADAGRSASTLQARIAAVRWAHEAQGHPSPTDAKGVRATMAGIRRRRGVAPRRKAPATVERLSAMLAHIPHEGRKALRDRALLLFGFASALRRSELVALRVEDLEWSERGVLVTLRRSKTDQEGKGHTRAVPFGQRPETCPVRALRAWLDAAGIAEGRVFRSVTRHGAVNGSLSAKALATVVKATAERAGFDPADFAGHSLRAGFVTSAAERGKTAENISRHTGHRRLETVNVYVRRANAFDGHPGAGIL